MNASRRPNGTCIRYADSYRGHLSLQQKSAIVKSFILPMFDYVLYLQPLAETVHTAVNALERCYLNWILNVKFDVRGRTERPRLLAGIPSLQVRRALQACSVLAKFKKLEISSNKPFQTDTNRRAQSCYRILSEYATLQPHSHALRLPNSLVAVTERHKQAIQSILEEEIRKANFRHKRMIPSTVSISRAGPVYETVDISRKAKHVATLWYLNKLVPKPSTIPLFPKLKEILEKTTPRNTEEYPTLLEQFTLMHYTETFDRA